MMQNVNGQPESSPYFKLAALHGWPGKGTERNFSYCEHRQETFPGWHRAYLTAFEEALQDADRANGNDGAIGLPYWDVVGRPQLGGQILPRVIREAFPNGTQVVRSMLADPDRLPRSNQNSNRSQLWQNGYQLADDRQILREVQMNRLDRAAQNALWIQQHYRAASTFGSSNQDSLESPHDMVHVLCKYPLESLMHAAFHPAFFLHHCNIDRLYESYLSYHSDSQAEFETNQETQRRVNRQHGRVDRYDQWLEPFTLPRSSERFFPRHTFDTERLGYRYDALEKRPNQAMTAPPVYAVFEAININQLTTSYKIYVFVYPMGQAGSGPPLGPDAETLCDNPNLAGMGALFAGKGDACANCQNSDPFDVRVNITEKLQALRLKPAQAELRVVLESFEELSSGTAERSKVFRALADTPVPAPTLRGGGKKPPLKYDLKDGPEDQGDVANYPPGSTVTYAVEAGPGYLPRGKLLNEVSAMFFEWAGPLGSGLRFKRLPAEQAASAQLTISWEDHSSTNPSKFDGPGGKLADADATKIVFDSSERWMLHGGGWTENRSVKEEAAGPAFFLGPVLLHEIGHALGLVHSSVPTDVMAPYYEPDRVKLTDRDKARVRAVYGSGSGGPPLPPSLDAYLAEHRPGLESAMTAALNDAILQRAPRPLKHVADLLLKVDAEMQLSQQTDA